MILCNRVACQREVRAYSNKDAKMRMLKTTDTVAGPSTIFQVNILINVHTYACTRVWHGVDARQCKKKKRNDGGKNERNYVRRRAQSLVSFFFPFNLLLRRRRRRHRYHRRRRDSSALLFVHRTPTAIHLPASTYTCSTVCAINYYCKRWKPVKLIEKRNINGTKPSINPFGRGHSVSLLFTPRKLSGLNPVTGNHARTFIVTHIYIHLLYCYLSMPLLPLSRELIDEFAHGDTQNWVDDFGNFAI